MANNMNLSLTNQLREFVNTRAGDTGLYATPSEYLRDLIRRDMESQSTVMHVLNGINDLKHGRFSNKSILDIAEED
ncbi:MAG: antitoxin ParD1/3/4 [Gammaproteobacteria bacterium]|jgi:antitoxin ParD1/3/4